MLSIETTRLRLLALQSNHLILLKNGRSILERHLGLRESSWDMEPEFVQAFEEVLDMLIERTASHPLNYGLYTNWEIVLASKNMSIGGVGLFTEAGQTMLGYSLDKKYHGKGYATEAVMGICRWVLNEYPNIMEISAETNSGNIPSERVLVKSGFTFEGDSLEGKKWVLRR
ncbi:GNAT family protein [Cytophagales bacterium LB-30]|uniref:GNAT family protein n=1 Tax=Shiella aurantiaca TaxID=3058365 RepID=A0ABT8F9U5_9BACT|nr:GNAT family protein [Shiella aurantiaca]MDN4167019.1 GNAT family protein [Shiella aurantiaca]